MHVHMAARLVRSVFVMSACAPSRGVLFVFRKYSEEDASMEARLSNEEMQETIDAETTLLDADRDVTASLDKCEERRSRHRPLPNRDS